MAAPCAFWARGTCKNGDRCRFEHIGPSGGGGGGRGGGGGGYEPRGGSSRGGQRGGRGDHYEPRPPAQHYPDNYREPQGYGGRGGRGGYQGGYQGGRQDDRSAYQAPSQRGGYQGAQPRGGYQNDYEPRGGRGGRGRGGRGGHHDRAPPPTPALAQNKFMFSKETLYADLTSEIPGWILSSYSPGTKTPVQLFGGEDREKSFEEMRLNHYMLREQGQEALAAQQQDELMQKALAQNENARNNVEAAVEYVLQGENEHPNRNDIADQYTKGLIDVTQPPPPEIQAIIQGALPSTVIPQALAQNVDAFGRPVSQQGQTPFGAPAAPAAFEQPSPFGGQPMQQQTSNHLAPSPFAQPQPQQHQAFGQPAQQQQQSPFAQAHQPHQSPFGAFAQPAQSAFGQPQPQQQQQGGFGAPAMGAGQNPLSPFNPPPASNAFNSVSMSETTPLPTPPTSFLPQPPQQQQQPQQTPMPFGHLQNQNPLTPHSSPFTQQQQQQAQQGQDQQQQAPQPPLQQQAQPTAGARDFSAYGPYAADAARYAAAAASQPFGTGYSPIVGTFINVLTHEPFPGPWTDPSPYKPGSQIQHPHISLYSTRGEDGRLRTWKNMDVEYRDLDGGRVEDGGGGNGKEGPAAGLLPGVRHADGRWERIWFPNGPPAYNPDTEGEGEGDDEGDERAYRCWEETGRFPEGRVPSRPPRREWTHWCF